MSTNYYVHVGPMVECRFLPKSHTEEFLLCTNCSCKAYNKKMRIGPVCNFCTLQLSTRSEIKNVPPDITNCLERFDDSLVELSRQSHSSKNHNYHIWTSNITNSPLGERIEPSCEAFKKSYTPEEIARNLAAFEQEFEDELFTLEETYGADNVTVSWGIFSYYM